MLTSEFKEELEDLGYKTTKMQAMGDCLLVVNGEGTGMNIPLVIISNRAKNSFSTNEMSEISDELFELLVEYASTPVDERVDEEREPLFVVTFTGIDGEVTAIEVDEDGEYSTVTQDDWDDIPMLTQEEVDSLPTQYHPNKGFTKIKQVKFTS